VAARLWGAAAATWWSSSVPCGAGTTGETGPLVAVRHCRIV